MENADELGAKIGSIHDVLIRTNEAVQATRQDIRQIQRGIEEVRIPKAMKKLLISRDLHDLVARCHQANLKLQPRLRIPKLSPRSAEKLVAAAKQWIEFHADFVPDPTQCDKTAHLCWALLVGRLDHIWVQTSTYAFEQDTGTYNTMPTQQARRVMAFLLNDYTNAACLVRFYNNGSVDGHSLVIVKRGHEVHTLQSYVGVTELVCLPGNHALAAFDAEEVNASSFGLDAASTKWKMDPDRCFLLVQQLV